MNFNLQNLVRENIKALKPYASARAEFTGNASIYLDANENPFAQTYNRYPDPLQWQVKFALAKIICQSFFVNPLITESGASCWTKYDFEKIVVIKSIE